MDSKSICSIAYDIQLDGDLDAKATAPNTENLINKPFVYTDDAGNVVTTTSVLSIGTHTLTATFTPTDTANYTSGGTIQNSITVNSTAENEKNDRDHNGGPNNGGCGIDFEPNYGTAFVPVPMMYKNPMFGSEPYGYGSGPSTTETPNSDSNGYKAKAHLSKHKHKYKNHSKHHKTGKSLSIKSR